MKLWKTFGISSREDISYYDTAGEFEAERFAVNLNRMIMDEMEEKGIIGPYEGAKPRAVLISRQQWLEMQMNQPDE